LRILESKRRLEKTEVTMSLRYREKKTTQAAARFLEKEHGRMSHMKLIKLLYLADRKALLEWGRPITFDWYFSLPHGPVLSFTLDKINTEPAPTEDSYWHKYISQRQDHEVSLLRPAPIDQLSPAEEALLDEIYQQFGHMDQWQLRDYSHTLPEWQDPQGSRLPISISDILAAEGFSDQVIREVEEALGAEAFADALTE
jgi:uncharacterized phage-associated protein